MSPGAFDQYFTVVGGADDEVGRAADPTGLPQPGWEEFAPLYDEHHARLYRLALLLCRGRSHQAEDAVAETLINVYRAWARGGVADVGPYARRALVNYITGRARRDQVASNYLARHEPQPAVTAPAEDRVVESAAAFELLGQLPPKQRAAIVLRFYEDLSYDQIATELDVTVGTVKAQVSTGLHRLRTLMPSDSAGEVGADE